MKGQDWNWLAIPVVMIIGVIVISMLNPNAQSITFTNTACLTDSCLIGDSFSTTIQLNPNYTNVSSVELNSTALMNNLTFNPSNIGSDGTIPINLSFRSDIAPANYELDLVTTYTPNSSLFGLSGPKGLFGLGILAPSQQTITQKQMVTLRYPNVTVTPTISDQTGAFLAAPTSAVLEVILKNLERTPENCGIIITTGPDMTLSHPSLTQTNTSVGYEYRSDLEVIPSNGDSGGLNTIEMGATQSAAQDPIVIVPVCDISNNTVEMWPLNVTINWNHGSTVSS